MAAPARSVALPLPASWRRAIPGAGVAVPAWLPGLLLAVLLTLPAWAPFLRPDLNLWQLFDGSSHLRKAWLLAQQIKDGNWYPRWIPDLYGGYGYPTFVFYAPATYYLTLVVALLPRVGLYESFQILGAGGAAAIVGGVYALAWRLWRHAPAAVWSVAAVAYAPYLFPNNLFMSGWVPQILGNALTVWLLVALLGLWQVVAAPRPAGASEGASAGASAGAGAGVRTGATRWWWAVALLTAALLLTHNPSAAIAAGLCAMWLVALSLWHPSRRGLVLAATAALFGALLAAFLWLPALLEVPLVQVERMNRGELHYRNQFLVWPGLHPFLWGLQERSAYRPIGFPFDLQVLYPHSAYGPTRLGLWQALTLGAAIPLFVLALLRARRGALPGRGGEPAGRAGGGESSQRAGRRLELISVGFGLAVFLLFYSQSFDWWLPLWERYALLRSIQLPARFLPGACLGLALAGGGLLALYLRPGAGAWLLAGGAAVLLGVTMTPRRGMPLEAGVSHTMGVQHLIELERSEPGFTNSTGEFLPRSATYEVHHEGEARGFWLYERLWPEAGWVGGRVRVAAGEAAVEGLWGRGLWTVARVEAGPGGARLAFHQLWFPGWRAWVDGRPAAAGAAGAAPGVPAQAIAPGFAVVAVPPGRHEVALRFGPSGPRAAGAALSLAALAGAAAWLARPALGALRGGPALAAPAGAAPARWGGRGAWARLAGAGLLAGAVGVAGVRLAAPLAPPAPAAGDALLLLDLAGAVAAAGGGAPGAPGAAPEAAGPGASGPGAAVAAPDGGGLGAGRFADVRPLAVLAADRPLRDAGPDARRWLYLHPPAGATAEVDVPPGGAWLQAGLALAPAAWGAPLGDGVRFVAEVAPLAGPGAGAPAVVLDATLNPRARGEQRRWVDAVADLGPWAGRRVALTLRTEGRGDPAYDWAGWGNPAVVAADPLTAARLRHSARLIAALALDEQ